MSLTGKHTTAFRSSISKVVSIFTDKRLNRFVINCLKDKEGRMILLKIEIDNNILTFTNLYAQNKGRNRNAYTMYTLK